MTVWWIEKETFKKSRSPLSSAIKLSIYVTSKKKQKKQKQKKQKNKKNPQKQMYNCMYI